jgi:uncharacterized lipoprotein YajG
MTRAALAAAVLLLTGCATVQRYATCDNARAALLLAQRAADRLCPISLVPED